MKTNLKMLALACLVGACGTACSSTTSGSSAEEEGSGTSGNPGRVSVVQQTNAAVCAQGQQCFPNLFAAVFDGGLTECTDVATIGLDASMPSSCTQAQVNACVAAINAQGCPDGGGGVILPTAPALCDCF
jgi:hypothetical protein